VAGLLVFACDPGVRYAPVGWTPSRNYRWQFETADLRLQMIAPGDLAGAGSLVIQPSITNLRSERLTLDGATIRAGARSIAARLPDTAARIDPGATKDVPMLFDLDERIGETLQDKFTAELRYHFNDSDAGRLHVRFRRSR
jgi:hypothetical protein